ncbi:BatD family protein [Sulfurospirillum sp. 1612]|uniref:BatD family protein n=1 Tax=Sulfurospirillum sp. 1612 TaxID=3094835 RepID=UPI002F95F8A2
MKQILGKIFVIFLLALPLFAGVKATVDKSAVYAGDNLNYTISIDGKNPKFPDIRDIGGNTILGVSSSQRVNIINGDYKSVISKSYTIAPTKSFTIPSFKVQSDGKTFETNPIQVNVVKPSASKPGDAYSVHIVADHTKVYVGQPVRLDVKIQYKLNANIDKISVSEPKAEDFWVKKDANPTQSMNGDRITQTYHYLLFPQKSGTFTIDPVVANIGKVARSNGSRGSFFNDPFFNAFNSQIQWRKIFSNQLSINVKPLPNNLEVYGAFHIKASVDKTTTVANKPVNMTIKITGVGNIDDIKKFAINLPNVVEYSDEPSLKSSFKAGEYGGVFTQKIALIADKDFVIPALKFSYFDKDKKLAVTKTTRPISITVKGGSTITTPPPKIHKASGAEVATTNTSKVNPAPVMNTENYMLKYWYFVAGLLIGIGGTLLVLRLKRHDSNQQETPLIKKIKKAKGDKELFDVLLGVDKADVYINQIVEKLEENLYGGGEHKISKKEIIEHFLNLD